MGKSLFRGQGVNLLASAARTTSSNSGNLKDTVNGLPACDAMALYLSVTALTGNQGVPVLDVWLDTSPDGGTTWFTAYKWSRVTSSTAVRRIDARTTGLGVTEAGLENNAAASTGTCWANTVLTNDIRVRWEETGANFSNSATFSVWAICMPPGTK